MDRASSVSRPNSTPRESLRRCAVVVLLNPPPNAVFASSALLRSATRCARYMSASQEAKAEEAKQDA